MQTERETETETYAAKIQTDWKLRMQYLLYSYLALFDNINNNKEKKYVVPKLVFFLSLRLAPLR